MNAENKVRTCLWFEKGGEEAARFYVTLLPDSHIESSYRPDPDGPALVLDFTLGGAPHQILNGGPEVSQSPAVSISVVTEDQAETDRLWEGLTADGGKEGRCAWLTDRWGVSWQIVPRVLIESLTSDDHAAAERAFQAMLTMHKYRCRRHRGRRSPGLNLAVPARHQAALDDFADACCFLRIGVPLHSELLAAAWTHRVAVMPEPKVTAS